MYLILRNIRMHFKFKNCLEFIRPIFSQDGVWNSELTNDVKKDIEAYWGSKINAPFPINSKADKYYLLSMFPYPSGNLHMGHVRVYTISDAIARFLRMKGKKVIHPIGWDAFGLPAENAAIERNIHPYEWTKKNIETMKQQLMELNISFDWDMELSTCDPSFYKWTQYLFLLMFEKGLAYKKEALVNWDPVDQTVLADEQVDENGFSWRSGCKVEKRRLSQWFLRTSEFSKDLFDGLSNPSLVEWRDAIKIQKHWIGVPDGFTFHFQVFCKENSLNEFLTVWTGVPELIYGATFVGISHDHHFNSPIYGGGNEKEDYLLNLTVLNPFNGVYMPIYVTSELDNSPATESFLGVPSSKGSKAFEFALKKKINGIDIIDHSTSLLKNSGELTGLNQENARQKVLSVAERLNIKVYKASAKLKDWLISRQRYWGTPIPIINCPKCKLVPVEEKDLPVILPKLSKFSGKSSSLKEAENWINVICPKCGGPATRETDTMDTFVDSSWYFLRFLDVQNHKEIYNVDKINSYMPIDLYIGGKEHATLHMFYARFVSHFLHSLGLLSFPEPFLQLLMQGMIMGKSYRVKKSGKYLKKEEVDFSEPTLTEKDTGTAVVEEWEKMSKSKYNGIEPQQVINEHGIDTSRLFILGSVVPQSPRKWNEDLFPGIKNWQWRLWLTLADFLEQRKLNDLHDLLSEEEIMMQKINLSKTRNYYVKGVTHNFINTRQLSVAIAKLQGLTGELRRIPKVLAQADEFARCLGDLIIMLAPLAPHFSSELWTAYCSAVTDCNYPYDLKAPVLHQKWPEVDANCEMQIHIKLNGEVLDLLPMTRLDLLSLSEDKAIELALSRQKVIDKLNGAKVKHAHYKVWPDYDSEVNIIFKPFGKKKKGNQKSENTS